MSTTGPCGAKSPEQSKQRVATQPSEACDENHVDFGLKANRRYSDAAK